MPTRRQFLAGSAAALGGSALPAEASAATAVAAPRDTPRPNFVVVLADDLGYGELGAYGQRLIQTPNLDRLAAEGLRFTDAYAGAPVCAPSRCSLLTGLHSGHSAVRQNPEGGPQGSLGDKDTTFAELLRARSYRTAVIGKWGFGPEQSGQASHPNQRGFEQFFGYITHGHAHDYYPHYLWHNGERTELPENAGNQKGTFAPDLFRDRSVEFIKASKDEPFLLFFTPNVPHAPSDVPATAPYDDRPWPAADKGHAAQVTRLDAYVGDLVGALREAGVARDTVLIVTSDNGPHEEGGFNPDLFDANGPLRGYKRNLYEGGVRVPLIAWSPGRVGAGTTARPTQQTDLLPTLAELAGAPVPGDIDGVSAAALLTGRPGGAVPGHLYWYRREPGSTRRANAADGGSVTRVAEAVRQGDWKAVRIAPGHDRPAAEDQWKIELYDLKADVGETRDLAAQHPAVAAGLVRLMREAWVPDFHRRGLGLTLDAPELLLPGGTYEVTLTLTNGSATSWHRPQLSLGVPHGWRLRPSGPRTRSRLAIGEAFSTTWRLTIPERTTAKGWRLAATATASTGAGPLRFSQERGYTPPPPPPTADSYLSDLPWLSATNGWGPVEIDRSNGKQAAGDGTPISFGGQTHRKGLGVHARSEIVYHLGGRGVRLTGLVGIDDFSANQSDKGATVAQVWADDRKVFDSGTLTAAGGPEPVDVDVTGARLLRLVVLNAEGTGGSYDHTSWADAFLKVTG
ncbi:sulfatase-like hydrolase/transferase [Actinomadura fulvescens]|uniref:Glycosyl hydrolase family 98 putative carbohydrate-binding module domain-containing protein n=1 Tax=Actinomadura fulvescens TaxID=46160 RepID=A0ABP6BWH7_9ACTN